MSNPPSSEFRPTSSGSDARQDRMVALLKRLASQEGYTLTTLPDVRFLRSDRPLASTPVLYEPGIVVVCQGRKRGLWADQVYLYDAQHYLAVSVPVPFTMETDASADEPLLAIYFSLDLEVLAPLALELDAIAGPHEAAPVGMFSTPMNDVMADSVLRFLQVMSSPLDTQLLGPAMVREIYYRVLTGEQGATMRAALANQGQFAKIARAVRRIHTTFADRLNVDRLADEAGMSAPSFHAHFRLVTDSSPMQYLKSVRLHQARLLMLRRGLSASAASLDVGYRSASQFSREFKRFFGRAPADEVSRLRSSFAMPPSPMTPTWVTSH
jgi:AraC-like DNA-binding protein